LWNGATCNYIPEDLRGTGNEMTWNDLFDLALQRAFIAAFFFSFVSFGKLHPVTRHMLPCDAIRFFVYMAVCRPCWD
jgi:hypothetical protein